MGIRLVSCALAGGLFMMSLPTMAVEEGKLRGGVQEEFFTFYGDTVVRVLEQSNGNINAFVLSAGKVKGSLHLDIQGSTAMWISNRAGGVSANSRYYDLSAPKPRQVLQSHTLKSAALSALLHWEDEQAQALPTRSGPSPTVGQDCDPGVPDGCTGWFDECGGISVRAACDAHDICYRCALMSRRACDNQLYEDVGELSGDWDCASSYYWGVRGLGWMFYQDPNLRPYMGPDVYALGITINGCEGYEYLCTTYIM